MYHILKAIFESIFCWIFKTNKKKNFFLENLMIMIILLALYPSKIIMAIYAWIRIYVLCLRSMWYMHALPNLSVFKFKLLNADIVDTELACLPPGWTFESAQVSCDYIFVCLYWKIILFIIIIIRYLHTRWILGIFIRVK